MQLKRCCGERSLREGPCLPVVAAECHGRDQAHHWSQLRLRDYHQHVSERYQIPDTCLAGSGSKAQNPAAFEQGHSTVDRKRSSKACLRSCHLTVLHSTAERSQVQKQDCSRFNKFGLQSADNLQAFDDELNMSCHLSCTPHTRDAQLRMCSDGNVSSGSCSEEGNMMERKFKHTWCEHVEFGTPWHLYGCHLGPSRGHARLGELGNRPLLPKVKTTCDSKIELFT